MNTNDFMIENGVLEKYVGLGGDVVIPEGVKVIGIGAFATYQEEQYGRIWEKDSRVKTVIFPKTLEEIRSYAFYCCVALETVRFNEGLKTIGHNAFSHCDVLLEAFIPDGVEWVETNAFSDCKSLKHVRVPSSIKKFSGGVSNPYAYERLIGLESFVLETDSQDKKLIAAFATRFFSLESLADYYINGKIQTSELMRKALFKRLNTKANRMRFFSEFIHTNNVDMTMKFLDMIPKISPEELDEYIIKSEAGPDMRAHFLEYKNRLYSKEQLAGQKAIQIEKELGLRERTLADWRKIYKINNEGHITGYKDTSSVAEVPAKVKNTVINVGANAFKHCVFLESITIEEGVTLIDKSAFNGCIKLSRITIPSTLQKIGASAFKNCEALKDVYFPGGITNIGSKAFEGCSNLIIHAPADSKILQYAQKNNIAFVIE